MNEASAIKRYHILVSGVVQGVGFRHASHQLSAHYEVCGWVRNISDGRVELEIQGRAQVLEGFLKELKALYSGSIRDLQCAEIPIEIDCQGFTIRSHR